jgi:hypothetical protein
VPDTLFQSDDHRTWLFQFLAAPENRSGFQPRPIISAHEEALRHSIAARPGAAVGIVADSLGRALDCAIRAGARRIALLGNSGAASDFLRGKSAVECSRLLGLTVCFDEAPVDILLVPLENSMEADFIIPEKVARYKKLLRPDGIVLPGALSVWVAPVANERLWSRANADASFEKMTETVLDGSFFLSEPVECFRFVGSEIGEPRELQFTIQADWFVDGLGCWLEASFGDHEGISCRVGEGRKQLFLPFPVRMRCRKWETLTVAIARASDGRAVWMEWAAWIGRATIPIQNYRGTASRFSLE